MMTAAKTSWKVRGNVIPHGRGYTLLEVLLTVALLGIAGGVLVPRLVNLEQMETQAAVRQLIGDITYAQADAVAQQEYRRIYFYDNGSGYCVVRVTPSEFDDVFDTESADYLDDISSSPGSWGRYIRDFTVDSRFSGVEIDTASFDSGKRFITFDSLGGTVMSGQQPGTGGQVTVVSDGAEFEVEVAPFTGKLTVREVTP